MICSVQCLFFRKSNRVSFQVKPGWMYMDLQCLQLWSVTTLRTQKLLVLINASQVHNLNWAGVQLDYDSIANLDRTLNSWHSLSASMANPIRHTKAKAQRWTKRICILALVLWIKLLDCFDSTSAKPNETVNLPPTEKSLRTHLFCPFWQESHYKNLLAPISLLHNPVFPNSFSRIARLSTFL